MLVAAALVPHTALLVPGAAGAADPLDTVRSASLAAIHELTAASPDRVVVVAPQPPGSPRLLSGSLRPSLAAAGIDDDALGWDPRSEGAPHDDGPRSDLGNVEVNPGVGASVALLLLRAAGWTGPVSAVTVATEDAAGLRDLGAELVVGAERVALVLAATLSARRGPDAPLPTDPRASTVDDAVLADLADLGSHSVARLAAVPAELARDLAISAWGPWQVLLGALREGAAATVHHGGGVGGVRYVVLSWRWT